MNISIKIDCTVGLKPTEPTAEDAPAEAEDAAAAEQLDTIKF